MYNTGNEFGDGNPLNMSFRVTLKKSHVDKRDHGAVSFLYMFSIKWTN